MDIHEYQAKELLSGFGVAVPPVLAGIWLWREQYLESIAELLSHPGPPDQAAIVELRARYDIEQLTSMIPNRRRAAG